MYGSFVLVLFRLWSRISFCVPVLSYAASISLNYVAALNPVLHLYGAVDVFNGKCRCFHNSYFPVGAILLSGIYRASCGQNRRRLSGDRTGRPKA